MLPSAPSTWGRRSINWFSSGMTRLTATPARARRLALPLSVSLNRATSRWAGSIYWLLFLTARLCASATACWKRVVSLSNLMSWVPHGQWEFVNAINVRTLTPISSHPRCNLPESRANRRLLTQSRNLLSCCQPKTVQGSAKMRGVIRKWGNSAAIRLPSSMLKSLRVGIDDLMEMRVERNCLILQPVRSQEYTLTQLVGAIKPANTHAEIDFGSM